MSTRNSRLQSLGFESYSDYLHSSLWTRNRVRALVGPQVCFICGMRGLIHFHHLTYQNIGDEQPGDVICLCREQHLGVHEFQKTHRVPLERAHVLYKASEKTGKTPQPQPKRKKAATRPKKDRLAIENELLREIQERNRRVQKELGRVRQTRRKKPAPVRHGTTKPPLKSRYELDGDLEHARKMRAEAERRRA